jgi:hypothetical protein
MLFKNSVRTSKRTPHFTITEINWLTLFKEVRLIPIQAEKYKKPTNAKCKVTDHCSKWDIYLPLGFKGLTRKFNIIVTAVRHLFEGI